MSRILSWFSSNRGRTFTHYCVGAVALTVFGAKAAINGPLLERLKEVCQVYKDGEPRPFPPNVKEIIKEVLKDCKLEKEKKEKLNFFYVVGHEVFHAGGTDSPWGALIGVPFFYEDMNNFRISDLRLPGKDTIDWIIDGRDLIDSFYMSNDAKKFALMREIYSTKYSEVLANGFIAAGCILLPAKLAQRTNTASKAFERLTLRQRSLRYILLYTIGYALYRCLKDPMKHLSDREADKLAAETGPAYLDGGIEFYEKTLMKNKALGELMNSRFRRTYDEHGNEYYLILVPKLPITKRLELLQEMKKDNVGGKEKTDNAVGKEEENRNVEKDLKNKDNVIKEVKSESSAQNDQNSQ